MCNSIDRAKSQVEKHTKMTKEKVFEAHSDKSGWIIFGTDKFKNKIEEEREKNPIYLTGFKLNIMSSTKYLGQTIDSRSAIDTVKSRAEIKGAAMEFKTIIEDFEMAAIGGHRMVSKKYWGGWLKCKHFEEL